MNFDSRTNSEFALNGRQVYMLTDLAPGVLFTREEFGSTGFSGTRGWDTNGSLTMGGGKTVTNSFSLNGAPISLSGSFVAGGWTLNWVVRFTLGNPIAGINAINTCGDLLVADQSNGRWWNNDRGCWRASAAYQLRTVEDRYAWLRQMDNITVNLAAAKTFLLTERWRFQLRGEAFNLANRPIYRPAPTTYTDVRFGMLSREQQNFPRNIQVSGKLIF